MAEILNPFGLPARGYDSEPKLFVPEHVKLEREADIRRLNAQAAFVQYRAKRRDEGVVSLVAEGYRVEELRLEEWPSKTGDPLLSTFSVHPKHPLRPWVLKLRRLWRVYVQIYVFKVGEGEGERLVDHDGQETGGSEVLL